jgi:hypothetical protein
MRFKYGDVELKPLPAFSASEPDRVLQHIDGTDGHRRAMRFHTGGKMVYSCKISAGALRDSALPRRAPYRG